MRKIKKGDKVRLRNGAVVTVSRIDSDGDLWFKETDGFANPSRVELITRTPDVFKRAYNYLRHDKIRITCTPRVYNDQMRRVL